MLGGVVKKVTSATMGRIYIWKKHNAPLWDNIGGASHHSTDYSQKSWDVDTCRAEQTDKNLSFGNKYNSCQHFVQHPAAELYRVIS